MPSLKTIAVYSSWWDWAVDKDTGKPLEKLKYSGSHALLLDLQHNTSNST